MAGGRAYYNEFDKFAAQWIREMIGLGVIPPGEVDDRSIKDVTPNDLRGFTQCHFFAGIGGWGYAARLAGWPDDRPLWTGSCPCQPFSEAGEGRGFDDPRDLWPHFDRLIGAGRQRAGGSPFVVVGEQVAGKAGNGWFDRVLADLARRHITGRVVDLPSLAVDAPHIRQRLYWAAVADAERFGSGGRAGEPGRNLADRDPAGWGEGADRPSERHAVGDLADTRRQRRGAGSRDGDLGHAARGGGLGARQPQAHHAAAWGGEHRRSDGGDLGDASGLGWREGRAERIVRSGRNALANADASRDLAQSGGVGCSEADGSLVDHRGARGAGWSATGAQSASRLGDGGRSFWADAEWILCHDGKARRAEPGVPLLAHGVSARVPKWRGFGNAINPVLAAEVLGALGDVLYPSQDGRAAA